MCEGSGNAVNFVRSLLTSCLQGHLHTYRQCDEVWTFIVKDAQLKLDNGDMMPVERARIVACKMAEGASGK
jgi:transcription initiation factor TFIIA small subunit